MGWAVNTNEDIITDINTANMTSLIDNSEVIADNNDDNNSNNDINNNNGYNNNEHAANIFQH